MTSRPKKPIWLALISLSAPHYYEFKQTITKFSRYNMFNFTPVKSPCLYQCRFFFYGSLVFSEEFQPFHNVVPLREEDVGKWFARLKSEKYQNFRVFLYKHTNWFCGFVRLTDQWRNALRSSRNFPSSLFLLPIPLHCFPSLSLLNCSTVCLITAPSFLPIFFLTYTFLGKFILFHPCCIFIYERKEQSFETYLMNLLLYMERK